MRNLTLPLTTDVLEIIERRVAGRAVRLTNQGKRLGSFRNAWQRAATAAGLGGLLVH